MTTPELIEARASLESQIKELVRRKLDIEQQIVNATCPHKVGDVVSFTDGRGTYRTSVRAIFFDDSDGYHLTLRTIRKDGTEGQTRWHITPSFYKVHATA
jgi:hypothetical protein